MKVRCSWVPLDKPVYVDYHDNEWGVPEHSDQKLFGKLCLDGAQAGLSWETILNKSQGYEKAFKNFDIDYCAKLTDNYLEKQLQNPAIVRNRLKVFSVRTNAIVCQAIQAEFGSFDSYLWGFVNGQPIINNPVELADIPTSSKLSDQISLDLKKRGIKFVGTTIIYAYLQAIGIVNDHMKQCFRSQIK